MIRLGGGVVLFLACMLSDLSAAKWTPVNAQELAATESSLDKSADAEVLESRVEVTFEDFTTTKSYYRRIKAYTARGVELVQKFAIENDSDTSIDRLVARQTKQGGGIVEYGRKDFHETTLLKIGGHKWISRRLIVATLAPGDIIEFKWEESWEGWAWFQFVYCQEELPVREFRFRLEVNDIKANLSWYNTPEAKAVKDGGAFTLSISNLPAYANEPDMLPELDTRGFILIAYGDYYGDKLEGWQRYAGWLSEYAKEKTKPDGKIQTLSRSLASPELSNEEKYRRYYEYCQARIVNIDYDDSPQSVKERTRQKEEKTAAQVLKSGRGTSLEINFLFIALAKAGGSDARIACVCSKDFLCNNDIVNGWYFTPPLMATARLNGDWAHFNPGNPLLAFGELRWQEENSWAVISDSENMIKLLTPGSAARDNVTTREADLVMDADGSLNGTVNIRLQGQPAVRWRLENRKELQADIEKSIRSEFVDRVPAAELESLAIENQRKPGQPLVISYKLKIPQFATSAGDRQFLVPNVFEAGAKPRYASEHRTQPYFYPYSHQIHDVIRITLPEGLVPNLAEPPAGVDFPFIPGRQNVRYSYDEASRVLTYKREFSLGRSGSVLYDFSKVVGNQRKLRTMAVEKLSPHLLEEKVRTACNVSIPLEPVAPGSRTEPVAAK